MRTDGGASAAPFHATDLGLLSSIRRRIVPEIASIVMVTTMTTMIRTPTSSH